MMYKKNFRSKPGPSIPKQRLIVGRKPLVEALKNGTAVDKIFILKSASGEDISVIKSLAQTAQVPMSFVPQEKLDRFTKVATQGVVAIASSIHYYTLQDAIDHIVSRGEVPNFLVLDGVTDTRNLGAMARTAFCMGCQAVVFPKSQTAAITDEAIKTSAGALEQILVCREPSIEQIMDVLHLNGFETIATHLEGELLTEARMDTTGPIAAIMGSEDKGISKYVLKTARKLIRIPQSNNFDSLNVSVAAGIILYKIYENKNLE